LVKGSIRQPYPEAMRFKSSFLMGCIEGIDFNKAALFDARLSISSNDLD